MSVTTKPTGVSRHTIEEKIEASVNEFFKRAVTTNFRIVTERE